MRQRDKDDGRGGGLADADLSILLVNKRGSERAARGAAGEVGGGEAGRKHGFGGRNNDHRAMGLGRGEGYRAETERPSIPACSEQNVLNLFQICSCSGFFLT